MRSCGVVALVLALAPACSVDLVEVGDDTDAGDPDHDVLIGNPDRAIGDGGGAGDKGDDPEPPPDEGATVEEALGTACTTQVVSGLSEQLLAELECMSPGTMARIDDLAGVDLGSGVWPVMQASAADGLDAFDGYVYVNSGLRTLAQQFVLYTWYAEGLCTDVVVLAARPGRSNHESGLALDAANWDDARSALEAAGYDWLGSNDPVHFDYAGGGTDLRDRSVLAFQRLWNRNRPDDPIAADGIWGPETEGAMRAAPAGGFYAEQSCAAARRLGDLRPMPPRPEPGPFRHGLH